MPPGRPSSWLTATSRRHRAGPRAASQTLEREVLRREAAGCGRGGPRRGGQERGAPAAGRRGSNHRKPSARSSAAPGRARPAAGRRWSAASIGGLPKPSHVEGNDDGVGGGVGVGPVRRRAGGGPGSARRGQERVELGVVAVLGRARQPVGGAERLGQARWRRARPCGRWPAPGGHEPLVVGHVEAAAGGGAVAGGGVDVEAVVDGGGRDAALGQLRRGEPVDGDVAPGGVVAAAAR